jgi:hypothetical protein
MRSFQSVVIVIAGEIGYRVFLFGPDMFVMAEFFG